MTLPPEIINAIRTDAEKKFPTTYHDGVIERDDLLFPLKREVYISGREEQLELMFKFDMWKCLHYEPIENGNHQGLYRKINRIVENQFYTTTELYIEYIKTREGK